MKSLSEQQAEIETELKQLENRQKILLNRKHKEERRERTHRLIELVQPHLKPREKRKNAQS